MDIKRSVYQFFLRLKFIGKKISIATGVYISKDLIIGENITIKRNVEIGNQVKIGNNVIIGKGAILRRITIGKNSHVESGVITTGYGDGYITIGEESYIGINNVLDFSDNITIGNYVHIAGPSTGIWTHSSALQSLKGIPLADKDKNFRPTSPIIIKDNVYIGGNCTIYPGVTIHHHSIVAPNSAVTKDVPPNTLVGGVPAKVIKRIKN